MKHLFVVDYAWFHKNSSKLDELDRCLLSLDLSKSDRTAAEIRSILEADGFAPHSIDDEVFDVLMSRASPKKARFWNKALGAVTALSGKDKKASMEDALLQTHLGHEATKDLGSWFSSLGEDTLAPISQEIEALPNACLVILDW
jgi:hypothetical protein